MLAKAYKEKGGGYKGGEGKKQKDLKRWGKENWSTREEYEKQAKSAKVAKKAEQSNAQRDSRP